MRGCWWVGVLVGCSSPHAASDAPVAGSDGAVDSGPLPIRITVHDFTTGTHPLADAKVQFIAPDGSMQTVMTGADGVAEAISPENTTVLVYQIGELGHPIIKSFAGAIPGDSIVASGQMPQDYFPIGNLTFAIPTMVGAAQYAIAVSCTPIQFQAALPITVVPRGCPAKSNATAVAWAADAAGTPISGPSLLAGLDLVALAGTTVQMPAFAGSPLAVTSEIANLPVGSTEVQWESAFSFDTDPTTFSYASSTPAAAQMTMVGVGNRTLSRLHFHAPGFQPVRLDQLDATRLTDFQVDAVDTIRPILDAVYKPAPPSIAWTESTTGRPATMINAVLHITTNGIERIQIHLHAPHGATSSIPVPPVPPEYQFQIGDMATVQLTMQIVDGATYDQMLQVVETTTNYLPVLSDPSFVGRSWIAQN